MRARTKLLPLSVGAALGALFLALPASPAGTRTVTVSSGSPRLELAASAAKARQLALADPDPATRPAPVARPVAAVARRPSAAPVRTVVAAPRVSAGVYSFAALESLWVSAGGPAWAEAKAAEIALCESGGRPWAHNPSGATGLWQILGQVVAGNLYDPMVNAENAVAKFRGRNNTFGAWVCQ